MNITGGSTARNTTSLVYLEYIKKILMYFYCVTLICSPDNILTIQPVSSFELTATTAVRKDVTGSKVVRTFNYFAYGSNMASSTMTALRNLNPIAAKAAILPQHRLAFNIPGTTLVEPSWASVEPTIEKPPDPATFTPSVVHGVLYKLSEEDFLQTIRTEGVPFAYRLHRCRVIPYTGDGCKAGQLLLDSQMQVSMDKSDGERAVDCAGVPAFTLRAGRKKWRDSLTDIPPSQSYLNVLIRGAKEFKLDRDYLDWLEAYPAGKTFVGDGIAERMLQFAEISQKFGRR